MRPPSPFKAVLLRNAALVGVLAAGLSLPAAAQQTSVTDVGAFDKATADRLYPAKRPYSPWAGRNFPTRPLFGDTHLHTMYSFDAGAFGARLTPSDAYRFAKGEEIRASSGQLTKLSRPLDFLVVATTPITWGSFPTSSPAIRPCLPI